MRISWAIASLSCALLLSGCSGSMLISPSSIDGVPLKGMVHGGRQPISGAHVYLYAVSTVNYGQASTSLLKSSADTVSDGTNYYVQTTASGGFSFVAADYTCPSASSQVYLYSVGGNANGTAANSAAGLLAGLGTCSDLASLPYVIVNEVSTVATAYALAGYATDATHISSSNTALAATGVANAFNTIATLETLGTGVATTTTQGSNGTVPTSMINTLADILAGCINSTGSSSSQCSAVLGAKSAGTSGTAPTDTATAAIYIAHNPWANIASLYSQLPSPAPFSPVLASAPNDFTLVVEYNGGGINYPRGIAVDASGNLWTCSNASSNLSELSPVGVALSPAATLASSGGYPAAGATLSGSNGIAIDSTGSIWITNQSGNSISKIASDGQTGANFIGGGLNLPAWIALDATGNVWVTNPGYAFDGTPVNLAGSVSEFSSAGTAVSTSTGYVASGATSEPEGIAADAAGHIWVADRGGNELTAYTASTHAVFGSSPFTGGGLDAPYGLAVDGSGHVWVGDDTDNFLSEFNASNGSAVSGTGYTGGGLSEPFYVAVDGNGNVWVASFGNAGIGEFNSSGTAITTSTGFYGGITSPIGLSEPGALAIDGSGNVWVSGTGAGAANYPITEFIGAAAPVVTPVVANLITPYSTAAVNKP